jgi:hypothetical protein
LLGRRGGLRLPFAVAPYTRLDRVLSVLTAAGLWLLPLTAALALWISTSGSSLVREGNCRYTCPAGALDHEANESSPKFEPAGGRGLPQTDLDDSDFDQVEATATSRCRGFVRPSDALCAPPRQNTHPTFRFAFSHSARGPPPTS